MKDNQESTAMYETAIYLLNASRVIFPYNKLMSDTLLSMSESITNNISTLQSKESCEDSSNKLNEEKITAIQGELDSMISNVKKEIEDEK